MGRRAALALGATALAAATAAVVARRDFNSWVALGPGGRPHTLMGWLDVTRMRFLTVDPLDVKNLEALAATQPRSAHLEEQLPQNPNPRPKVDPHPVPHRVVGTRSPDEVIPELKALFDRVEGECDRTHYAHSYFERHHDAITALRVPWNHVDALKARGEIAHIHPSDCSMHMVMHPSDAAVAVRAGWGELHTLSGGPLLPSAYLMVYPPQQIEDLEVVGRLLRAAIAYSTDEEDLKAQRV